MKVLSKHSWFLENLFTKKEGEQLEKALPNREKRFEKCQVTSYPQITVYSHPQKSQKEG